MTSALGAVVVTEHKELPLGPTPPPAPAQGPSAADWVWGHSSQIRDGHPLWLQQTVIPQVKAMPEEP